MSERHRVGLACLRCALERRPPVTQEPSRRRIIRPRPHHATPAGTEGLGLRTPSICLVACSRPRVACAQQPVRGVADASLWQPLGWATPNCSSSPHPVAQTQYMVRLLNNCRPIETVRARWHQRINSWSHNSLFTFSVTSGGENPPVEQSAPWKSPTPLSLTEPFSCTAMRATPTPTTPTTHP